MTDFNNIINLSENIVTKYQGKELILKDLYMYDGPLTMQLLPYGGIQSLFNYQIILHVKNGYIASKKVIYDNCEMNAKEFILKYNLQINDVLPN